MVMDFEKGKSFADWLVGLGRRPTQAEFDRIVAPLLEVLALMHKQNFLHRDIAPDNIIIRDDGSPVLLDFGAARRAVAEISRSITSIVKGGYSPPEQYASDSRAQGPWTDLYALGATLYPAVAGRPPDDSPSRADTDVMPSAARAAIGTYRPGFLAAIDRCLAVKASARPQSVEQLRPLLLGQEEEPCTSGRSGKAGLATSASPRRPLRWVAAVAAAVVLLAGGYAGVELLGKRPQVAAPDPKAHIPRADPTAAADAGDSQTLREAQELRAREDARLKAEARAEGGTPEAAAKVAREAPANEAKVALAPSPPAPVSKQPFDGVWRATITAANDFCVYKSGDFLLSITNGAIVGGKGYHIGSVGSAGDLVMTGPARANSAFKVRFTAKLSEGRGQGQYRVLQGKCIGSFAVKKLS
ncbi:MAG: serine/threonine protein kinase [Hyphomicrobiaceae bacterium]